MLTVKKSVIKEIAMSFVFSGLLRLNVQPAVGFNDPIIDLREPYTLKADHVLQGDF